MGVLLSGVSLLALGAPPAQAHAYFEGSTPAPGARAGSSPRELVLHFDESLNRRLSTAAVYAAPSGRRIALSVSFPAALEMALTPLQPLPRGSYRVEWHSVSTDDGHELEGSFSFGVQAPALGGATSTVAGPLSGLGWLRTLLRAVFYAALFLFAGGLMMRTLLGGRERDLWLLPDGVRRGLGDPGAAAFVRAERSLVLDAGLIATALSAGIVVVETQIAAGIVSPDAIHSFLLTDTPGLARAGLVLLLSLAVVGAVMAPRYAGVVAALALGELALSGHADSASPRAPAVLVDWVHLLAGSLWLGGIAVIVLLWLGRLRGAAPELRRAVIGELLPRFGRVALPAFLVVVLTGLVNAYIQLRHPALLWESSYGRALLLKSALVAIIASVSYAHVFRLRPRLLAANPHPAAVLEPSARATEKMAPTIERRHWRLLRSEPLIGIAVAVAVAVLVAFPLPRDVAAASTAAQPGAACNPCVLPLPDRRQLAVATNAGSEIVAGWLRRRGEGLEGQVRVLDIEGRPASTPFEIEGATAVAVSCGPGCRTFTIHGDPPSLTVVLSPDRGQRTATLPTRWQPAGSATARRTLDRAQRVMRSLRSVRQIEDDNSVPGIYAVSDGRMHAPDRWAETTSVVRPPAAAQLEDEMVEIGSRQWTRQPGGDWQLQPTGGALPFSSGTLFTWSTYAEAVRLLGIDRRARPTATLALMDPGTPAWWTLRVDLSSGRVFESRLITSGHFITTRYTQFNTARPVLSPTRPGS